MATLTAWKQDKRAKSQKMATKLKGYLCVKCGQTSCWAVPRIRNNVLQGLDLKRNRTPTLRASLTGSNADTVTPKICGSTQRKSPVICSKEYLLAATWLQWLKPVSQLSTLSNNKVITNLSSQKWKKNESQSETRDDSHHLETKARLLKRQVTSGRSIWRN